MNINKIPSCKTCDDLLVVPRYRLASSKYCNMACKKINTPESLRHKKRLWRAKNIEKIREQSKIRVARWASKNPERAKSGYLSRGKKYFFLHREEINRRQREDYKNKREIHLAYAQKYIENNKEKIKHNRREKYAKSQSTRLRISAYSRKREAIKRGSFTGDVSGIVRALSEKKTVQCFYCGKIISVKKIHLDHVNPLCKGGAHAAFNLVPSCPSCNCRKQGMMPNSFIKAGQLILVF